MLKDKTMHKRKTVNITLHRAARLSAFILSAVIILASSTFAFAAPVQAAADSAQGGPARYELHAFYPANAVFSDQITKYIDSVDSLSFAWCQVDVANPGVLNSSKSRIDNQGFYYPSDYMLPLNYAKSKGKSIQLSIYADTGDAPVLLPYAGKRTVLIDAIVRQMKAVVPEGINPQGTDTQGSGSQGGNVQGGGSQEGNTQGDSIQGTTPQGNNSQGTSPQGTVPQGSTPDVTAPQATAPHEGNPRPTNPQETSPQATTPQATVPQTTIPQTTIPQTTVPQDGSPQEVGFSFDGVVIDFEGLKDTDNSGQKILYDGKPISAYYVQFLKELKSRLQAEGKHMYVAVNPRLYYNGFDYKSILQVADRVILMAHDYEPVEPLQKDQILQFTSFSPVDINSPAPIQQVKKALDDMKKSAAAPSDLSKVWLQVSFSGSQWEYGISGPNDWDSLDTGALSEGGRVRTNYALIKARVDNADGAGTNIIYGYNNQLQSPFIQYYNTSEKTWNVILYEDSTSVGAKMDLAKSYGLGGISLWSLNPKSIPDYNDPKGKQFHLDVWNTVIAKIKTQYVSPAGSATSVRFADKAVEKAVRNNLDKPSGNITAYDVKCVYRLTLPTDVKSLADLKMLVNLEYLDASGLGLKDISALASLTKLRILDLEGNMIPNVAALKKLVKLQVLTISKNKMADFQPLAALPDLRELYATRMDIKNLKTIGGLKQLGKLNLSGNVISDISPLSGLKKLYSLSMDTNNISNLKPLGGMTAMKRLTLTYNRISDIQILKNLKNLQLLYLSGNSISDLRPLTGLLGIRDLSFNKNKVTDIKPLSALSGMEELYMMNNKVINLMPLKGLSNLHKLYMAGNPATDLSPLEGLYDQLVESDIFPK